MTGGSLRPGAGPDGPGCGDVPRHTAMSDLRRVRLVAEREFVEYARQRSYRNGTIISALFLVAVVAATSILPRLLGGPDEVELAFLPGAQPVVEALLLQADPEELELAVTELPDRAVADRALLGGEVDAVIADPATVVVAEQLEPSRAAWLQEAMDGAQLASALDTNPDAALAAARVTMAVEVLDPPDPDATQRRVITLVGVLLAFGQVLGGAFVVANGLVEEKTSRVVEVIVAKAHPRSLLGGKLVGLFAVLTVQLLVMVTVGLTAVAISPELSIPAGLGSAIGAILFWYLLAFVIYGALFSIAGALSARQEDMALKMQPMMYLAFTAFGAAFYASANPDAALSVVASYVPFTAPTVVPARQVAGVVAAWEVALSVAVTVATAWLAVRFAGRVYTGGALRTRGVSTLRAAITKDSS
jgi:ABC-2 type transport system permease protein